VCRGFKVFRKKRQLEAKGTEFYGGTAVLIPTKEPSGSANQSGHWRPPSFGVSDLKATGAPAM